MQSRPFCLLFCTVKRIRLMLLWAEARCEGALPTKESSISFDIHAL